MVPGQDNLAPDQENLKVPPEQEHLNRQLEALGRYVADFQQQREHAKAAPAQPPPAPASSRPSRFWLLVTGVLVVVALVGGVAVGAVALAISAVPMLAPAIRRLGDPRTVSPDAATSQALPASR